MSKQDAHPIHYGEAILWSLLSLVTLLALSSTWRAAFPARERALIGELVVLCAALLLAALAWRRVHKRAPAGGWQLGFAAARVLIGVPVLSFALVASAAGFAA